MTPSDELHKLIMSLSKAEKRFFKLYAARHVIDNKNNSIALFDVIALQKTYNETLLKNKFKDSSFINRFAASKNYLKQLIIKSMRSYHTSSSIEIEIKEGLIDLAFLYKKGLYIQCEKLIKKIEKIVLQSEKNIPLIELLEWKIKLTQATRDGYDNQAFFNAILKEEALLLNTIRLELQLKNEVLNMFSIIREKGDSRSESELKLLTNIVEKYKNTNYNELTFEGKYYLNFVNSIYYNTLSNYEKSYFYVQKNVALFESLPSKQRKEELNRHVRALNNLVVILVHLKKDDSVQSYILKIQGLSTSTINKDITLWIISYKLILGVNIKIGEYKLAEKIVKELVLGIEINEAKIPISDLILFKYNIAVVYFANEKYKESNKMLNEIINNNKFSLRDDIQIFTRILRLIIMLERNNYETLSYSVISTYRFLYKKKRIYKFEATILNFIRKNLPKINTERQLINSFKELRNELSSVINNSPFEQKILTYFDFISWLDSKIQNKPFTEIIKKKLKK